MNLLRASNLCKSYRNRQVVKNVIIEVEQGEIVGLLGPNGAGKTTTFYMVVGLVPPEEGQVYLGEEDITKLPMHMRAKKGISYLPQEPSVFRNLTVEENVIAVLETLKFPKFEGTVEAFPVEPGIPILIVAPGETAHEAEKKNHHKYQEKLNLIEKDKNNNHNGISGEKH